MENNVAALSLIVSVIVAIWGVYQTYINSRLQTQIHKLTVDLDQTLSRLHRAKELVIELQALLSNQLKLLDNQGKLDQDPDYREAVADKSSELSSRLALNLAELTALALVIDDALLIDIILKFQSLDISLESLKNRDKRLDKLNTLGVISIAAHYRIYQLSALTTVSPADARKLPFTKTNGNLKEVMERIEGRLG